jgi:hypothetical protein
MNSNLFNIVIMPRLSMEWDEFVFCAPHYSIALDGIVKGGPRYDPKSNHVNFDHHECVIREATMSTAMQVLFAIKGGLLTSWATQTKSITVYINDTDQDTSLAVWLLRNYKKFEGSASIPHINRLIALTDKLDITGGAYPMNLDDQIIRQHAWVFHPYLCLRKSGKLAIADENSLRDNLEAVNTRINQFMMNQGQEIDLDTRHTILYDSPYFKIVEEIGGNDARYYLFSQGMNAFVSIIATRPDGRLVCTIGKRSQYINFPIRQLYQDLNNAEDLTSSNGWNGSDIIGGSSRVNGTGLSINKIRDIINNRLKTEGIIK